MQLYCIILRALYCVHYTTCIILRALYCVHYTTCIILHVMIVSNKSMHYPACYDCIEQHAEIRLYYSYNANNTSLVLMFV